MDATSAAVAFAALAQPARLALFRRLLEAGPQGLPAGEAARALGVPHNTMSAQLAALSRAGLLTSRREGRVVRYHADIAGVRALLSFLLSDCCGGRPEACLPLLDAALAPPCLAPPGLAPSGLAPSPLATSGLAPSGSAEPCLAPTCNGPRAESRPA